MTEWALWLLPGGHTTPQCTRWLRKKPKESFLKEYTTINQLGVLGFALKIQFNIINNRRACKILMDTWWQACAAVCPKVICKNIKLSVSFCHGLAETKGPFTLTSFGPDRQTFQLDPIQNYRCETSLGPLCRPNCQTLVQQKEVVSVWIKLNHGSVQFGSSVKTFF